MLTPDNRVQLRHYVQVCDGILDDLRAYPKTERKAAAGVEHDRNVICSLHGGGYVLRLVWSFLADA